MTNEKTTKRKMGAVVKEIENKRIELDSLLKKKSDIQMLIGGISKELIGYLSFGMLNEQIKSNQLALEVQENTLLSIQEEIRISMSELKKLGEEREMIKKDNKKELEKEKQIRIHMAKAISEKQLEIYNIYNQLEKTKKELENGTPLDEIKNAEFIIVESEGMKNCAIEFKMNSF